jgi:hypothetical protein
MKPEYALNSVTKPLEDNFEDECDDDKEENYYLKKRHDLKFTFTSICFFTLVNNNLSKRNRYKYRSICSINFEK